MTGLVNASNATSSCIKENRSGSVGSGGGGKGFFRTSARHEVSQLCITHFKIIL